MRIVFADATLALIETDRAGETQLPVAVIMAVRRKLTVLRASIDERSLQNWKSLHYEKLRGCRDGRLSVRVDGQHRLLFDLNEQSDPKTITVQAIEDWR